MFESEVNREKIEKVNEIVGKLLQDGENWISDFKQNDDITLVVIRRTDAA